MDCMGLQASHHLPSPYWRLFSHVSQSYLPASSLFPLGSFLVILNLVLNLTLVGQVELLILRALHLMILSHLSKGSLFPSAHIMFFFFHLNPSIDTSLLCLCFFSRGVWAMIAVFLAYSLLQAPSTFVNHLSCLIN